MCVQYRGGCSVPWCSVVLLPVKIYLPNCCFVDNDMWGDIMSTVGVFSTVGGYHPLKFEYRGGISQSSGPVKCPHGTDDIPPRAS